MVKKIIDFVLRRRDPVAKAIYLVVTVILLVVAGLAKEDALTAFAEQLKLRFADNPWIYWSISFLHAYFVGGDWVLLGILVLVLAVLAIVKIKSKSTGSKHLLTSHIRDIETLIGEFKTSSAFALAKKILTEIDDTEIDPQTEVALKAKANFLLGQSAPPEAEGARSFFLESYALVPGEIKYKERAATTNFFQGNEQIALQMATEILVHHPVNERAHAIRVVLDPSYALTDVPQVVFQKMGFKRIYAVMLLSKKPELTLDFLFESELKSKPELQELAFDTFDYWVLFAQFAFYRYRQLHPAINMFSVPKHADDELLIYVNKLFKTIHLDLVNTEFYQTTTRCRLVSFRYFQSSYFLTSDKDYVQKMRSVFEEDLVRLSKEEIFFQDLFIALLQVGEYKAVIDITEKLELQTDLTLAFRIRAFSQLEQWTDALNNGVQYLKTVSDIGSHELHIVISIIEVAIHTKEEPVKFYENHIAPKRFSDGLLQTLTVTYAARYNEEYGEMVRKNLDSLVSDYVTIPPEHREVVLMICAAVGEFSRCNELIDKYHNWKEEPIPLFLLTGNLIKQRDNSEKLLEVLRFRRSKYAELRLLLEELNLYLILQNFEEVLAISILGRKQYGENPNFHYFYIVATYRLGRHDLLDLELNDSQILNLNLTHDHKFYISKICIERNMVNLGLELFYRVTKSNLSDPAVKERFFVLATFLTGDKTPVQPTSVLVGTVVKVVTLGDTKFFDVTEVAAATHWICKGLLGKSAGSHVELDDPVIQGRRIEVTIAAIFDKYVGLAAEIADEVGTSNLSGMALRSVHFEGPGPENLVKTLVENFGQAGDRTKVRTDEAMEEYYLRNISFTELVRRVSSDNPLEIYAYLTSPASKGFVVAPIPDVRSVILSDSTSFVIDLPSLIILAKLSESFPALTLPEFGISQYLLDHLSDELTEARRLPDEGLSISITSSGVHPTVFPPAYKKARIETIERLLTWAKTHCKVKFSPKKLDLLREHPEMMRGDDWYYNYIVDTSFITAGSVLISDDTWHVKIFPNHYPTITTEVFLKHLYPTELKRDFIPILIINHYRGIRISSKDLQQELKKITAGPKSTFNYCLDNLSYEANHDVTMVDDCLDFIKGVYGDTSPIQFKRDLTQTVFVNMLKGYPDMQHFRNNIKQVIRAKFHLLQIHIDFVINDLNSALVILGLAPLR